MVHPQSAIANKPFGPQSPSWAGCLQAASAICNCSRAIRALTSFLGGLPAWCIRNLQLQTSHSGPNLLLGGLPARCIRNLQLQTSRFGTNLLLGRAACMVHPQSAIAAEHLKMQPIFCNCSQGFCNCSRASTIAAGYSATEARDSATAAEHLQLQPSHSNPTSPLGGLPAWCIRNAAIAADTHTHTHTHTHTRTHCAYWSPQEEAPAAPAFINL